ncbi:MAG TPA: TetR/AcrR family transcriptional regulator C-terminal domain-containing protein [Dokdonella sp.]
MPKVTTAGSGRPIRRKGGPAPPGSRAGLEREHIAAAAVAVLDADGLAGLSTRRIAARLGVRSAALYWHVRDKRELLALAAETLCADMTLPSPHAPARERLRAIAHEYRRVLLAHRDAARLFAEQPPLGPHRMRLYDAAVGAFVDAGFEDGAAAAMATFYRNYLLGMIAEETRHTQLDPAQATPAAALAEALSAMGAGAAAYPNLRRVADRLAGLRFETMFELGLGVLLDGIARRRQTSSAVSDHALSRSHRPPTRPRSR